MIQANSATIASRNVALPHGKNRKTTKSALAAIETTAIGRQLGSPRTASAMVSGASTPVAMIKRNAMPCTQPCQVAGFPPLSMGTSTRKAAKISATPNRASRPTANRDGPSVPALIGCPARRVSTGQHERRCEGITSVKRALKGAHQDPILLHRAGLRYQSH